MMERITHDALHEVLACDSVVGKLYWKPRGKSRFDNKYAGKEAGYLNVNGYTVVRVHDELLYRHRLIWIMHHGEFPEEIDHINGVRSDDRLCNLRDVNRLENCKNASIPRNNTSGRIGVHLNRHKNWVAEIGGQRFRAHLGTFKTFEEACSAREAGEIKYGYHENHGRIQ